VGSRGVVFGDVMRANDAYNDRIDALREGAGGEISVDMASMTTADLADTGEVVQVCGDLVQSYTGITEPTPFGRALTALACHSLAIGVLTERQRHEDGGVGVRETRLADALDKIAHGDLSLDEARGIAKAAMLRG
jgi:hypothetical protein